MKCNKCKNDPVRIERCEIARVDSWTNIPCVAPTQIPLGAKPIDITEVTYCAPLPYEKIVTPPPPTPPLPPIGSILNFTQISDPNDILYLDINEVPNVRLGSGGIKVYSKGKWEGILWYNRPSTAIWVESGVQIAYLTGIVYYYGDNANQLIVQIDNTPFILFRCVLGTVTIPLIDGYKYSTNGLVSGSNVILSIGQYIVFYKNNPPSIGTIYTKNIENGTGFIVNLYKTNGENIPFYLNFGNGEGRILSRLDSYNRVAFNYVTSKYISGNFLPPGFPYFSSAWGYRSSRQIPVILDPIDVGYGFLPAYMNDPNTTSYQSGGIPLQINYIADKDGYWGWSIVTQYSDTSYTNRYQAKLVHLRHFDGSIWKIRKFFKIILQTSVYNYDQGGTTTGLGLRTTSGVLTPSGGYAFGVNYYDYTTTWTAKTFSTTGYTWVTGAKATRVAISYNGAKVYIYTKWLTKPQETVTTKYARYYTHCWLNHYYTLWADTYIPSNAMMGVEEWFAETDQYEVIPPDPVYQPASFYDQFFP